MTLDQLKVGQTGLIVALDQSSQPLLKDRLRELGFIEGESVTLAYEAPFVRDPVAVHVRGTLVALRRDEARAVQLGDVHG